MEHRLWHFFIVLFLLLWIPGCGRQVDWGKEIFYQGKTLEVNDSCVKKNIRSIAVYDQFTTRALFDALLLSDAVRTSYATLYARKLGKNEDQYNAFLRRQLEENKHYLCFYVLSLCDKPLGEATSEWNLFLQVDGIERVPTEIKVIDLPAEYQLLLGKRFNRFRVVYSVKFAMKDMEDQILIKPDTQQITLVFRSLDKEATLTWKKIDVCEAFF